MPKVLKMTMPFCSFGNSKNIFKATDRNLKWQQCRFIEKTKKNTTYNNKSDKNVSTHPTRQRKECLS